MGSFNFHKSIAISLCLPICTGLCAAQPRTERAVSFSVITVGIESPLKFVRKRNVIEITSNEAKGVVLLLTELGTIKPDKRAHPERVAKEILYKSSTPEQRKTLQQTEIGKFKAFAISYNTSDSKDRVATAIFAAKSHLLRCDFIRPRGSKISKMQLDRFQLCIDSIR